MEGQTIYYVRAEDENIGTIWTLIAPQEDETLITKMRLGDFMEINWSVFKGMKNEIDAVLADMENWNRVRSRIDDRPGRKKRFVMDTLPRTIALLKRIRAEITD